MVCTVVWGLGISSFFFLYTFSTTSPFFTILPAPPLLSPPFDASSGATYERKQAATDPNDGIHDDVCIVLK